MFFIKNLGKQKDIYKYTMQKYSNAVRSKDLIDVASVDMIRNSKLDKEIQKFILDIHINGEKKKYKEKVKYLKNIYEKFGVEELLYGYIYYSSYILNVQLSSNDESEDDDRRGDTCHIENNDLRLSALLCGIRLQSA